MSPRSGSAPPVAIIMGSRSDWPTLKAAALAWRAKAYMRSGVRWAEITLAS